MKSNHTMFNLKFVFFILPALVMGACQTGQIQPKEEVDKHAEFLEKDESSAELFHVLISSDRYDLSQMRNERTINRTDDKGGDKYISSQLEQFNMIDEVREAVFFVQLRPDSGSLSRIRTQRSTALTEIDKLLAEDIQRWTFKFPQKIVTPTSFNIRYRIVLKKTMSDSEIMEEVRKRSKERR